MVAIITQPRCKPRARRSSVRLLDDEEEVFRVLKSLRDEEVSLERAKEIIRASDELRAGPLGISEHMLVEMEREPLGAISRSELEQTIARGTSFWDNQKKTMLYLERDVYPGEVPVAALVKIDDRNVVTVWRETRSEEGLAQVEFGTPARERYVRLTRKE